MNEQQLNDDPFEGIAPPPPPPPLNEGQQWAHDRTVAYVTNQGPNLPKIILIRGFAGTGKTFTTNRIVKTLQEYCTKNRQRLDIAASAPTHKAVRCLRKAGDLGSGVTYATIHSLLGLRPEPEEKHGKQEFKKSGNPDDGKIGEYNVLILDEISQLGAALWQELMAAMDEYDFKLILLGDEVQIPPVKEKDSLPFLEAELYGIEDTALTQSMRQAGDNPILDYATEIRNTYKTSTWVDYHKYARVNEKGEGLEVFQGTNSKAIRELLEDKFGSDRFRADPDYMKVVTWTNRTASIFNNQIRRMLYAIPEGMVGLPMIVHGEKLIMNDRYIAAGEFKPIVIPNNEELEVEKYEIVKKAVQYKLYSPLGYVEKNINPQIYKTLVRFKNVQGSWIKATLDIAHETATAQIQSMLTEISDSAKKTPLGYERKRMWEHFWEIKGRFADIGYNYALTSHKAQGSTYENCVMVAYDIKPNPKFEERNRIAYVAGTRAKKMLYIIE
jgi:hypothetical protein